MSELDSMTLSSKKKNVHEQAAIDLSIIIPSFNSKKTIRHTLKALCEQTTQFEYEIIVVDSSNDGSEKIIEREFPQVKLIRLRKQTYPGTGRNLGVRNARGRFVAFTDADCLPDTDWVERIIQTFSERQTEAVGGCLINGYRWSLTAWVGHLIEFNEWTETTPAGFVTNIPSANLAYQRQAFTKYDEYFPDYLGSEDTILNWQMQKKGARLYFDPKIRLVHLNRSALGKLFKHQYMLGRWSAEARRQFDLPGNFLVKHRLLVFLLPFIRWLRAFLRLASKDLPKLLIFVLVTPLYIPAAYAWSVGFVSKRKLTYSKTVNQAVTILEENE
ncbi:MAG: glycosyltransferase [bacterium]